MSRLLHWSYNWQLRHVTETLEEYPEVENVRIEGNEDIFYEVEYVEFSIANKPGSRVALVVPHGGRIDQKASQIELARLGPWAFAVYGYGYVGVTSADTGEEIKSTFRWNYIDVSTNGPFATKLPIEIKFVGDIVSNYDQLVEAFGTWPGEFNPGSVTDESRNQLNYFVLKSAVQTDASPGTMPQVDSHEEE